MANSTDKKDSSLVKRALTAIYTLEAEISQLKAATGMPIAIIGAGCHLPGGVEHPAALWELLMQKKDAVTEIRDARWDSREVYDPNPAAAGKMYNTKAGFVHDVDKFDNEFFNISPLEAIMMDPQQRLALQTAWHALEDAGIAPDSLVARRTGVFMGMGQHDYAYLTTGLTGLYNVNAYYGIGNGHCFTPGRISHLLGLRGPSVAMDTACSSSLLAIHMACQSLRNGECELALAGGVQLMLSPLMSIYLSRTGALSTSGSCRTFSADADGFVRAEGTGIVVLKKLDAALADGDRIMAVIRGGAVNHDGKSSGITVPNGLAQEELVRDALQAAAVLPEQISFIEAHGTGTPLGDPIELDALQAVFGRAADDQPLWIGAVKSNIGHLEAAAGVTGLIKASMALQHRILPPNIHFTAPNPQFDWSDAALKVPVQATPLDGPSPLAAGVSAFGLSGTNVHLVLEEAPAATVATPLDLAFHLVTISARDITALLQKILDLRDHCIAHTDLLLHDIAFTSNTGRQHFQCRTVCMVSNLQALQDLLSSLSTAAAIELHNEKMIQAAGTVTGIQTDIFFRQWPEISSAEQEKQALLLAGRYVKGDTLSWQVIYSGCNYKKVVLPLMPFKRQRYWIDMLPGVSHKKVANNGNGAADHQRMEKYLFDYTWIPFAQEQKVVQPSAARRIIFLQDVALQLRWQKLSAQAGGEDFFVYFGEDWRHEENVYTMNPTSNAHWQQLRAAFMVNGQPLSVIYHSTGQYFAALQSAMPTPAFAMFQLHTLRLLMQELISTSTNVRLAIVTDAAGDAWHQAGVTGFCKCMALEQRGLLHGILELNEVLPEPEWQAVLSRFLSDTGEPLIAYRNSSWWVPRVQAVKSLSQPTSIVMDPGGAYLVTGGMGYLGLKAVKWLAENGARKIFISSRQGTWSNEGRTLATLLQQQGVHVWVVKADVTSGEEVAALIQEIQTLAAVKRISGVVHAAGAGGLTTIAAMQASTLEEVCGPKIAGTWWLYEQLKAVPPDFFIAFSSIAAAWGGRGQSHYTAANQWMEALLLSWRTQGCQAVSVRWGPWFGGGLTSNEDAALLESIGVTAFPAWQDMHVLNTILGSNHMMPLVVNAVWPRLRELFASAGQAALFDLLPMDEPRELSTTAPPAPLIHELKTLPLSAATTALQQLLQKEVANLLVYQDRQLPDLHKSLFDIGMDSLSAIQLADRIRQQLGVPIKVTSIFEQPTLSKLSTYLLQQVRQTGAAAPVPQQVLAELPPQPPALRTIRNSNHPVDLLIAQISSKIEILEQPLN